MTKREIEDCASALLTHFAPYLLPRPYGPLMVTGGLRQPVRWFSAYTLCAADAITSLASEPPITLEHIIAAMIADHIRNDRYAEASALTAFTTVVGYAPASAWPGNVPLTPNEVDQIVLALRGGRDLVSSEDRNVQRMQ